MAEGISENDLPSVKFEKEIKELMNYSTLQSYAKNQTGLDVIDSWIQRFQTEVEQYLTDSSKDSSFDPDKRCRHFNYIIITTINKINSLSDDPMQIANWSKKIKNSRDKFFSSNPWLNCNEYKKYTNQNMNILGNFCEDSDFIKKKISDIQNSNQCNSIRNNISSRKDKLAIILQAEMKKGSNYTSINNQCNINNLDSIFPFFTCISSSNSEEPRSPLISGDNPSDSKALQGTLRDGSPSPIRDLHHVEGEPLLISDKDGENNTIGLVSLPILGILVLSFLLYRYTPLGSKFHTNFRNKEHISINQADEATDNILYNESNLGDNYFEKMEYNLSYQTMQN
ncbi:PIR Superfamily Protein [Plasmodium ovale curtisi]|uniref:PIR Superfamily Protein n=1 Tax=Plasmodium ovale curtisi TaxID=864141 RepID=A0A1A8WQ32_PLAOA|nr:PIR Superfamily Protein [Plasmodium ovale curtisi]